MWLSIHLEPISPPTEAIIEGLLLTPWLASCTKVRTCRRGGCAAECDVNYIITCGHTWLLTLLGYSMSKYGDATKNSKNTKISSALYSHISTSENSAYTYIIRTWCTCTYSLSLSLSISLSLTYSLSLPPFPLSPSLPHFL